MPIYEYRCTACGKDFERLQKMTDNPLQECPFCRGKVRKLLSNTSFHLKGTGWYVTDYARKSGGGHEQAATKKAPEKSSESGTSTSDTSGTPSSSAQEPST
jgi:putative FmdB family regulatory protein